MSKRISIKIDDDVYKTLECFVEEERLSRNAYINQAICFMNRFYARRKLRQQLRQESNLLQADSLAVLREFEAFQNEGM